MTPPRAASPRSSRTRPPLTLPPPRTVLLLNLLIAIMGDSYEQVKEVERLEGLLERAKIIVDYERLYPRIHTYPKYLHLLEKTVEGGGNVARPPWEGVSGKVKQEIGQLERKLEARLAQSEAKLLQSADERSRQIDDLRAAVEAMHADAKAAAATAAASVPSLPDPATPRAAGP